MSLSQVRPIVASASPGRVDRRGLAWNVGVTLLIAVAANGILTAFGLNRAATERWPSFAPPGHTIGFVWVALFAAMGAARWFAISSQSSRARDDARCVTTLIGLCLAYPFYTHLIGGHATELCGNAVTFGYAAWLVRRLQSHSPIAATLIGAVALWIAFATVLVFALVGLNGWAT